MMHCPLCRGTLDRYDLRNLGYSVSPMCLSSVATACADWRLLLHPRQTHPHPGAMAKQVVRCARMSASDGFVYNCCVLAIDRMINHKRALVRILAVQWQVHQSSFSSSLSPLCADVSAAVDLADFVQQRLASHVEVLIHSASAILADDGDDVW
jgi:hypothetical protein